MEPDWRALLPTAYLLTGSDAGARDLLARGLARGPGLDDLVRAHLRRRLARDTAIAGTSGDPWWLSAEDVATARATAAALDGLPRPERTAAVLRWHEGLPDDRVAALVPGVDPAGLPDRLGIPERELPRRLEGLAALADLRDLTDDDVARGVRELRGRRRSRALLAVGAVAVLGAGAVWLPDALPAPAPAAAAADSGPVAPDAPVSGPARGSLADDPEFVTGLRDALDPGPDDGRLLYAGDAAGLRWALLVLPYGDGVSTSWFVGPEGADPADMLQVGDVFAADRPAAWSLLASVGGRTAVLVVAEPGDQVELSDGFVVAADGTAGRDFAPLDLDDGVAALPLAGARTGSAVVFRLSRDGGAAVTGTPSSIGPGDLTVVDPPPTRSGSAPVDATAFEFALAEITRPTGIDLADLDVSVLGSGTFPGPGGTTARAVTVAAVLPGGAVATSTAVAYDDGSAEPCGTQTLPAGTDPATTTVVTRCASYAGDSSTFGVTVVVVAPLGVGVTLNSAAGGDPVVPDLIDGWGYVLADGLTQFAADGVTGEVSRSGSGPFD